MSNSNLIITSLMLIFGIVTSVIFWYFIAQGNVYDNWYPLVGHLVASHGLVIGASISMIRSKK